MFCSSSKAQVSTEELFTSILHRLEDERKERREEIAKLYDLIKTITHSHKDLQDVSGTSDEPENDTTANENDSTANENDTTANENDTTANENDTTATTVRRFLFDD